MFIQYLPCLSPPQQKPGLEIIQILTLELLSLSFSLHFFHFICLKRQKIYFAIKYVLHDLVIFCWLQSQTILWNMLRRIRNNCVMEAWWFTALKQALWPNPSILTKLPTWISPKCQLLVHISLCLHLTALTMFFHESLPVSKSTCHLKCPLKCSLCW